MLIRSIVAFAVVSLCGMVKADSVDPCEAKKIMFYSAPDETHVNSPEGVEDCGKIKTDGEISVYMTPGHNLSLPNIYSIESTSPVPIAFTMVADMDTAGGSWKFDLPNLVSLKGTISGQITAGDDKIISMPKLTCWHAGETETDTYAPAVLITNAGEGSSAKLHLGGDSGIDLRGAILIEDEAVDYSGMRVKAMNRLVVMFLDSPNAAIFSDLEEVRGSILIMDVENDDKEYELNLPKLKAADAIAIINSTININAANLQKVNSSIVTMNSEGSINGTKTIDFVTSTDTYCSCSAAAAAVPKTDECAAYCNNDYILSTFKTCDYPSAGAGPGDGSSGKGSNSGAGGSLSAGAIAGIVIGSLFFVLLLGALIYYLSLLQKNARQSEIAMRQSGIATGVPNPVRRSSATAPPDPDAPPPVPETPL